MDSHDQTRHAPPPSRLYWICQAAGWGGFTAYVAGGTLAFGHRWRVTDFVNIVVFCALVPPLVTHALRAQIYARGWLALSFGQLAARGVPLVAVLAGGLAEMSALGLRVMQGGPWIAWDNQLGFFAGFAWAFAGWLFIYVAVHARRRHDALTLVARDAQLRSLRAQLNPHFLFNCLNSVRSLIIENPERASAMVTGLAEILRYSLTSDRYDTVPLVEEMRVIDEYVGLERMRFEERLRVEQSVEPAAREARVPPMLVHTLVENAVKHGIARLPQGGVVRLDARVRDGLVTIVVTNSGRFAPPANHTGHGLRNATERLRLLYGPAASLTIGEHDRHTVAVLTLPRVPAP
jgi:hypothetical protein